MIRSKEELKVLFKKFDSDTSKRSWGMRLLLATDQWFNVAIWNGSQDETISSHISRLQKKGKSNWANDIICCLLQKLEYNHCKNSLGE